MTSHTRERLTENEIRPDEFKEEQARRFARDVERVLQRRSEFLEVPCPACGSDAYALAWRKYGLDYARCDTCQTVYMNPRPSPAVLDDYYTNSENYAFWNEVIFPASEGARRNKLFRPRAQRLIDICQRHEVRGGTILEVGAGFGTFGEELSRLGFFSRYIAVEPTPTLAETCRKRGLEVIEARIEDVSLPAASVSVIAAFEVVEHLFEPREFLSRCARLLEPGGVLLITCPNVLGFDVLTLREKSSAVDIEHLNYFHPASLARLFRSSGIEPFEVQTPGLLDAELVRSAALRVEHSLDDDHFLRHVLIDNWDTLGGPFQEFLAANSLSSHLWLAGRKRP